MIRCIYVLIITVEKMIETEKIDLKIKRTNWKSKIILKRKEREVVFYDAINISYAIK